MELTNAKLSVAISKCPAGRREGRSAACAALVLCFVPLLPCYTGTVKRLYHVYERCGGVHYVTACGFVEVVSVRYHCEHVCLQSGNKNNYRLRTQELNDEPRLTFGAIYNSTNYAQLRHHSRPYTLPPHYINQLINQDSQRDVDVAENGVKDEDGGSAEPLLVGLQHDVFGYSVLNDEYIKGVKNIDPISNRNKTDIRGKRGVFHLYNMLYCASGCDPLSYKGYGCYCGFLGSGKAVDGIDRCCKMHDECYEDVYCPLYTVYLQPYYWTCHRGEPLCALENHRTNAVNGCAARLCECDRKLSMCIRKYSCPKRRAFCRSSPLRLLQNLLMFK